MQIGRWALLLLGLPCLVGLLYFAPQRAHGDSLTSWMQGLVDSDKALGEACRVFFAENTGAEKADSGDGQWTKCIASVSGTPCVCQNGSHDLQAAHAVRPYDTEALWRGRSVSLATLEFGRSYRSEHLFQDLIGKLPTLSTAALLRLPVLMASSLHPDACFVAVARSSQDNCKAKGKDSGGIPSQLTILVLDGDLETLLVGSLPREISFDGALPVCIEDFRLISICGHLLLIVHGHSAERDHGSQDGTEAETRRRYSSRAFELTLISSTDSDPVSGGACPSALFVQAMPLERFRGTGIGLLLSDDKKLLKVQELSDPVRVSSWDVDDEEPFAQGSAAGGLGATIAQRGRAVAPIALPHQNAFLTIVQTSMMQGTREVHLHRFVLFESQLPYRWLRVSSRFFCFSVQSSAIQARCERSQVATSLTLNNSHILVAYALESGETSMVRLPLQSVLADLTPNSMHEGPSSMDYLDDFVAVDPAPVDRQVDRPRKKHKKRPHLHPWKVPEGKAFQMHGSEVHYLGKTKKHPEVLPASFQTARQSSSGRKRKKGGG